jgi:hypothetical protein
MRGFIKGRGKNWKGYLKKPLDRFSHRRLSVC